MKASERVVEQVLDAIAGGEFPVGEELPAEGALAVRFEVSRLTIREATGALAAAGVLEVQQGRRNRVAETSRWTVLDPAVVAVRAQLAGDAAAVITELMEARRVLEVGLARLAARRIRPEHLEAMAAELDVMRECREHDELVERSAAADIRFHEILQEAAQNPYLSGAFEPLGRMLLRVRLETSKTRQVRDDAIMWHERILEALAAHDEDATAAAMAGHMTQTATASEVIDRL